MDRFDHLPDSSDPCPGCGVIGQPSMDHTENSRCVNPECRVHTYRPVGEDTELEDRVDGMLDGEFADADDVKDAFLSSDDSSPDSDE